MDVEIETERFIDEVRVRPLLWNTKLEQHRDRSRTKDAWAEIASELAPEIIDEKEKDSFARELQMKWRNLRDALMRAERYSKADGGSKTRRKYRYADQMAFLNLEVKPRLSKKRFKTNEIDNYDEQQENEDLLIRIKNEDTSCSSDMSKTNGNLEENFIDFQNINSMTSPDDHSENLDEDMCFFQSLIPSVRKLDLNQKLSFRINVMTMLQQELRKYSTN